MSDKPKETEAAPQTAAKQTDPMVAMQHETYRYVHKVAIGEEWFDVALDGMASFPLRLVEAAETAGFRRVV